jgi:hypothetical protein
MITTVHRPLELWILELWICVSVAVFGLAVTLSTSGGGPRSNGGPAGPSKAGTHLRGVTVLHFDDQGQVVEHRDYDNRTEGREPPLCRLVKRSAPVSGRANGFANATGRDEADSARRGRQPPILCPGQRDAWEPHRRADVIGSVAVGHQGGAYTMALYFISDRRHAKANANSCRRS